MRVSERMRYDLTEKRINNSKDANAHALDRLASQKQLNNISDDPLGAAKAIDFRNKIENLSQFQTNIEFSKGYLERTESALQNITDNLIRAKELAIAMSNDTYDAASRKATSKEVRELIEEVVQSANSSFNGKYVFGGFRNRTPPVNKDGEYLGDDGKIFIPSGKGDFKQINITGRELFEATTHDQQQGHFNMVHALELLREGLMENDKKMMHTAISELEFQMDKTTSYQAKVGSMWQALHATGERANKEESLTRGSLSGIEDADIYKASSEFKRTEVVLQSTLLAANKLLQPSLLNFLQ
jgi:flagellar hook-associated protein 3 FlgL